MVGIKKGAVFITLSLILLAIVLLGILGERYQRSPPQESATPESASMPDIQLLELHIFKEELMLDVPVPALRFQIKFRTPQKVDTKMKVELQFKGALKEILGDTWDAITLELVEEHFGWTVYTFGHTIGGNTFSPTLLDTIVQHPYEFVSARVLLLEKDDEGTVHSS